MIRNKLGLSILIALFGRHLAKKDIPCQWDSKSGATFNLQHLTKLEPEKSFSVFDGDIPCTTDVEEPSFNYAWNFCADVTKASIPDACSSRGKGIGVALQWLQIGEDSDCYIIGHYDPSQDDLYYSLLDSQDPSKGISMKYPSGENCKNSRLPRTATIDIQCSNTPYKIVSAQEPSTCNYHLVMKSYYGCPSECPITSNGLCDSHGHCAYDYAASEAYCYCNLGHYGSDCSKTSAPSTSSYDGYSVQLGLLITLLLVTLSLLGGIGFMVHRVTKLRKDQVSFNPSPPGTEMVETVHF